MATVRDLERPHKKMHERHAAHMVDALLAGFGPKQARNLLQVLGLTQHEIPLDSRVAKWLKSFGFPAPVSAAALSDADFYDFALDGFQQIASACCTTCFVGVRAPGYQVTETTAPRTPLPKAGAAVTWVPPERR